MLIEKSINIFYLRVLSLDCPVCRSRGRRKKKFDHVSGFTVALLFGADDYFKRHNRKLNTPHQSLKLNSLTQNRFIG